MKNKDNNNYELIKVEAYHIREGIPEETDSCAIAIAIKESGLIDQDNEWVKVEDYFNIYAEWSSRDFSRTYEQAPLYVHPEDQDNVNNFIDWYDTQCDFDDLSAVDEKELEKHTLTFRIRR